MRGSFVCAWHVYARSQNHLNIVPPKPKDISTLFEVDYAGVVERFSRTLSFQKSFHRFWHFFWEKNEQNLTKRPKIAIGLLPLR